jgi:ribosome-associated translation inhibitor RaiA
MHIEISHDNHLHVRNDEASTVSSIIEDAIARFADRITRVECHLGDVNAAKGGPADKRCMLEARLNGLQPVAVTHQAESLQLAIEGAAEKLDRALEHKLGKLNAH